MYAEMRAYAALRHLRTTRSERESNWNHPVTPGGIKSSGRGGVRDPCAPPERADSPGEVLRSVETGLPGAIDGCRPAPSLAEHGWPISIDTYGDNKASSLSTMCKILTFS